MNISLPDTLRDYVEQQVSEGGYSTSSEYVRDLIRQDQKRKAKAQVEALLLQGLDSGAATVMTEEDWDEVRQAVRLKLQQNADG